MSRKTKSGVFISRSLIHLSAVVRYGVALAAAEAAAAVHLTLTTIWDITIPYIVFYPAVMISAWFGGLGPGLVTIVSGVAAYHVWLKPHESMFARDPNEIGALLLFIAVGGLISALNEAWRNAAFAIAESEEHFRVTLASIGDAVITTDEIGIVTHLNMVAEGLTGWTQRDGIGRPVEEVFVIINERTLRQAPNSIEKVLMDGLSRVPTCSALLVSKDGRKIPIDHSAAPIETKEGRTSGVVAVFRDITVRRIADQERAILQEKESAARRQAEEANRAKDEFLAMVSHELRTPLSSILGWTTILKSKDLPATSVQNALEVIERNAQVEAQLVESLLDLSRITVGKLKVAMEPVDLSSVVTAAVDSLRPSADAKGVIFDTKLFVGPIAMIGDIGRLQQIFSNVLSNAIKFTPRHGHVRVQLARNGSEAQVQVVDDGEGISPEFMPHIFDRFRQADSPMAREHGGLGLGLAIVRELVLAHGGTILAHSLGKGCGSTFIVTLPVTAVAVPQDPAPPAIRQNYKVTTKR